MAKRKAAPPQVDRTGQLIVVVEPDAEVAVRGNRIVPETDAGRAVLEALQPVTSAAAPGAEPVVVPVFGSTSARIEVAAASVSDSLQSPLATYFTLVDGGYAVDDEVVDRLLDTDGVVGAYVKPQALPPDLNDMLPSAEDPPAVTPDFSARQVYVQAPPDGVNAVWARTQQGGGGAGVQVVDVEGAWRFTHEDLVQRNGGVLGGTESSDLLWRNHGTAVVGVISADANQIGITGISPDAFTRAVPIFGAGWGSSSAIRQAADALRPGDILLVELHRAGPKARLTGQFGFIAVEWWPDDFDAIVYAVGRGVIVVAAAGNGSQDLDAAIYDKAPKGFPPSWKNPFRRGDRDSGAILVGAGAPPPGTHGRDWGPARSRLDFSNFGAAVDVQGWGREVTTCGYGELQGGEGSEDAWYTDMFSGTSSASPIVVGSIASAQGILRAKNVPLLTPSSARSLLRATGTAQEAADSAPLSERIGSLPDIRALVEAATRGGGQDDGEEADGDGEEGGGLDKNVFKDMLRHEGGGDTEETRYSVALDERLREVEQAVAELRHFITEEERPDVGGGALLSGAKRGARTTADLDNA